MTTPADDDVRTPAHSQQVTNHYHVAYPEHAPRTAAPLLREDYPQVADFANFTPPPWAPAQLDAIRTQRLGCILGLQDSIIARAQLVQLRGVQQAGTYRAYYLDKTTRDLTIPAPNSRLWLDVERDCLDTPEQVADAIVVAEQARLPWGTYCNWTSILSVFGSNPTGSAAATLERLAANPLWYAGDPGSFRAFAGWSDFLICQYSSGPGPAGLNADLDYLNVTEADAMIRLNAVSAWYADPAHQRIAAGATAGVNARSDYALPPEAVAVQAEVYLQDESWEVSIHDGDEPAAGEPDGPFAFLVPSSCAYYQGRVNLSPDGWFYLRATDVSADNVLLSEVNIVGYYLA